GSQSPRRHLRRVRGIDRRLRPGAATHKRAWADLRSHPEMLFGKKIVVVMPAYNAESTLRRTYSEIPFEYIDEAILVDDGSSDRTVELARELGCRTLVHLQNKGYGGN